jgi:asparagine synthase (glutamine-hydrolysing)
MSGIFGSWNVDGRPLDSVELQRVSSALAHRGGDEEGTVIQGSMGIGCRLLRVTAESVQEARPFVTTSQVVVVFDGRLDNREDLLVALRGDYDVEASSADAALVAAAYERFGLDVAGELVGDFAAAVLDARRKRIVLVRDAIGVKPLYYYNSDTLFVFASEIKAILSHPDVRSAPNDEAIATFVQSRLHAQLADGTTFFKHIKSVPPAHLVIRGAEGLSLRRYWDFDVHRYADPQPVANRRETFRELLKTAVRRRLRSAAPVAISVSGGLDSSSIFCLAEALRLERPTELPQVVGSSYTHEAGSGADESRFLSCLEERWHAGILRIPTSRAGYSEDCFEATWHGEAPFVEGQWRSMHHFCETLQKRGIRRVLGGHWGDQVLDDGAFFVDLFMAGEWATAWRSLNAYAAWDTESRRPRGRLARQFGRDLLDHCTPEGPRRMLRRLHLKRSGIRAAQGWYAPALLQQDLRFDSSAPRRLRSAHQRSLYREARSQYHVICMEWNEKIAAMHGLEIAFPFLDRDLVEFLISVPGQEQMPGGRHKQLLRDSMRGLVPDAVLDRRDKADSTEIVNGGLRRDRANVLRWLGPGAMVTDFGYVKPDMFDRLVKRWSDGPGDSDGFVEWAVSDLLGLEIWLQLFFGGRRQQMAERLTRTAAGS